jgi:hypothetical protein
MKEFDHYIFIDYSVNLIGYLIIEKKYIEPLLPKIQKFSHYRDLKHKNSYLHSIKNIIERYNLPKYFLKLKIREMHATPEIYADLAEFLKKSHHCCIFVSIDDKQYSNFERFIDVIDGKDNKIIKESELKKDSKEYKLSLILDTLLNIERLKRQNAK